MELLRIVLLLLYALPLLLCLPITSTPLEDNPENLVWDTQLPIDNRFGSEQESMKKIPKSIFITPNNRDAVVCPPGYTMGDDRKCYKSQNFNLDPLAILKTQVETFLVHDKVPTTVDYDEDYDYESYDTTESSGPLYVPLGFGVRDVSPNKKDNIQSMPFLAENSDDKKDKVKSNTITATESSDSTKHDKLVEPILSITPSAVSNIDEWNNDDVAVSKDINNKIQALQSTTPRNSFTDITKTAPEQSSLILNDAIKIYSQFSTIQKKDHVENGSLSPNEGLDDAKEVFSSTENTLNLATTLVEDQSSDVMSTTLPTGEKEIASSVGLYTTNHHVDDNHIETTEQIDEDKILDKELQSESLFQDDSFIGASVTANDATTETNENDVTTEHLNDQEVSETISTPTSPIKQSKNNKNRIVIVPTVEQVQVVTPVQQSTTTHHRATSSSISQPLFVPSSTSTYNSELQTAERLDINDSISNKKLQESVIKHELNEDAIETIDTNNRFVYTHLGTSSNEPDTLTTSTTIQPFTQRNLLEQLKFINKFTDESRQNNRIRFPEPSSVNIFSNYKGGLIKFPGPVQQRTSEPLFNRLIPEHIAKKPPEPTVKPLFSWMPAGISFDFNRNSRPVSTRFWNKMPLIRDPAVPSNDSPDQPRSNSKSPTDNLYKDVPTSDLYKVVSSKNYKHDNR